MRNLQIFATNGTDGISIGLIRDPRHLTHLAEEIDSALLLTPPLPANEAFCVHQRLGACFGSRRKAAFTWATLQIKRLVTGWPRTVRINSVRHDNADIRAALRDVLTGRIVSETRLMSTMRQRGLWPAAVSQGIDLAAAAGEIEQFPGISIGAWGEYRCNRCSSTNITLRPCSDCGRLECPVCLDCAAMGEIRGCGILLARTPRATQDRNHHLGTAESIDYALDYKLTDAQLQASNELLEFLKSSRQRTLIWAACGAGKTEVTFNVIRQVLRQGKEVLFAIPRTDIVRELAERLSRSFQGVEIACHYGGQPQLASGRLVVATTHQVLRFYRRFDLVILDEVDAFPYQGSEMLRFGVQRATAPCGKIVEMTATPGRIPKRSEAITIPARYHGHPLPEPKLKAVRLPEWAELETKGLPEMVLEPLRRPGQSWIVFAPTITACEALYRLLAKSLGRTVDLCYSTHPKRRQVIEQFRKGQCDVLVSTSVLERGVTFPGVQAMVLYADHQLFTTSSLVQMAGRVGRKSESPDGEVLFFAARVSSAMRTARTMIKQLNSEARSKGLLHAELV